MDDDSTMCYMHLVQKHDPHQEQDTTQEVS
jgi:hypothetical protein